VPGRLKATGEKKKKKKKKGGNCTTGKTNKRKNSDFGTGRNHKRGKKAQKPGVSEGRNCHGNCARERGGRGKAGRGRHEDDSKSVRGTRGGEMRGRKTIGKTKEREVWKGGPRPTLPKSNWCERKT